MKHEQLSEQLLDAAGKATPGEWQLQDGCSWRRIGSDGKDGNVICPTNHRLDGHPDLTATYEDLRYIVAAQPANIRSLIEGYRDQLKTVLDRESASQKRHDDKLDELEAKLTNAQKESSRLNKLINTPHIDNFMEAVLAMKCTYTPKKAKP